ncbi:MAG: hypothetical protein RL217_1891 [Pseudomonadota bacterium]|jgi:CBS domain containing-hemolysin-like protein
MSKLTLYPVANTAELVYPEQAPRYSLESPATQFFTDFYLVEPLVIDASISAIKARETMIRTHVRLKLVVDENKHFLGVANATDLSEQAILSKAAQVETKPTELLVTDLMRKKQELLALNIDEVKIASIGDVVNFLKDHHRQHCLVMDPHMHQIRGVFSASDISRKLQLPININEESSFSKVYDALI